MSDFTQNGVICTLPRLNQTHLEPLDSVLLPHLSAASPISLILPCHAPDLERPALEHICQQLAGARWLTRVLVPVNGLPLPQVPALVRRLSSQLPCKVAVFSTDAPALRAVLSAAAGRTDAGLPPGKGLNVWAALGVLHAARIPGTKACVVPQAPPISGVSSQVSVSPPEKFQPTKAERAPIDS